MTVYSLELSIAVHPRPKATGIVFNVQVISSGSEKGKSLKESAERVRYIVVRTFPSLGRAGVELYAVEFFLKGLGNKRTSLAVLDKAPYSILRVVEWAKNLEVNVSWVGKD